MRDENWWPSIPALSHGGPALLCVLSSLSGGSLLVWNPSFPPGVTCALAPLFSASSSLYHFSTPLLCCIRLCFKQTACVQGTVPGNALGSLNWGKWLRKVLELRTLFIPYSDANSMWGKAAGEGLGWGCGESLTFQSAHIHGGHSDIHSIFQRWQTTSLEEA